MTTTTPTRNRVGARQTAFVAPWCSRPTAYVVAVLSTLVTLLVYLQLPVLLGRDPLLIIFLVPIILSAYVGGGGPGFTATALSALLADYYIITPVHSFHIGQKAEYLRWLLLIMTGILVSLLSEALHRSRRQAERNGRRFAVTLGSIGDAVITTDKQGRITLLNGEAERLTGWTNEEARGQELAAVFRIINEKTRQPVEDPVKKVFQCGTVVGLANHTILQARNGRETPIDDSGAPIKQDDGEIIGVVLVFHDCTERKKAEDALALFRTLIDRSHDSVEVVDPISGRFLDVNESTCHNLGYTREEMLGLTVYDIDPLIDPAIREETRKKLEKSGSLIEEGVHRRKDGTTFPVELNKQLVRLDRDYMMVVARDITERKESERMLEFLAHQGWEGRHEDFLARMVEHIGRSLGVAYVFVGRVRDSQTVRTVGLYSCGQIVPDREYSLAGSPCQNVVGKMPVHYGERLQELFPEDGLLRELGAHSYLGFPLADSTGKAAGLLVALDTKPMPDSRRAKALLQIAAIRAAGELERLAAETTLRESEALYRSLISASPDAVTVANMEGVIEFVSARALEVFGGSDRQEVMGSSLFGWVAPEEQDKAREKFRDLVEGKPDRNIELVLLKTGGRRFNGELNAAVLWAADGSPKGLIIITRDVTERKQAEEMQKRLATAVEQAAEDIIITDNTGKIIYANPAFEKNTGYAREKVIGCNPRILKSGRHDVAFYREMWDTLNRGEVWCGHIINKRKNGTLLEQEATISPIRDAAGAITHFVAVKHDVTREVALEAQLRQSQKLEAIGRLAGGIAHDFNNLLTVIRGSASLVLLCNRTKSPEITDCAQQIVEAAERAANLTRQLLMFGRQQVIQPMPLDLNAVVAQMTKLLQRLLGEDISLTSRHAANLPAIRADTGMIEQVLLNLAVNSRDAMPQGGKLTIITGTAMIEREAMGKGADFAPGLYVRLTVTDTGTGIAPENLPHIFEPFFSTKEVGKGTGLGLATVHGIVLQHEGRITVASEVNQGTTFQIYFPALPGKKASEPVAPVTPVTPELPAATETILVVEDEHIVRLTVCTILQRLGYTVLSATSGREAIRVWRKNQEQIQLLLTDIIMPDGMTGFELARQLQAERPALKVIYTSGYSGDLADKRMTLIEGANFLQKPYAPQRLAAALRANLDPVVTPGGDPSAPVAPGVGTSLPGAPGTPEPA
jgi:PAS domain S-box-containing protein